MPVVREAGGVSGSEAEWNTARLMRINVIPAISLRQMVDKAQLAANVKLRNCFVYLHLLCFIADLSKIGRLFRVLKMKSSTSKCRQNDEDVARPEPDAAGDPEQDVAREGFGLYSDVSDSDNLVSDLTFDV